MTIVVITIYFLGLLAIGVYAGRQTNSVEEFFVAKKGLGYWVCAFSARATGESGWLLLGLTGMGYAVGVQSFWVVMGEAVGVTISWIFLARPFKRLTDRYESITMADYLESRFEDKKHILRYISSFVILTMVIAYLSAQLTATGKAFRDFLAMDFNHGVILGVAIVLFYTMWGGFRAVALSDFFQGILMLLGLILVPLYAIFSIGGFEIMFEKLASIEPNLVMPFGKEGFGIAGILVVLGFLGPGLGFVGSPQIYSRMIAVKDEESLVKGSFVAVLFTVLADSGAVLAGMAGRIIFPGLADQEAIFPTMASQLFNPVITAILIAVVLAAIMSTADSLLILAVSALVRDIYQQIFRPEASQEKVVFLSRALTVVIALLGLAFALLEVKLIFWFVLFAWAGITSAFCPIIILSLFWDQLTLKGAIVSMVSGFLTAIIWKLTLGHIVYEIIPGFLVASISAVLVSKMDPKKPSFKTS